MPVYDFKCWSCGEKEELIVPSSVHDGACSKCGSPSFRLPSFPNVHVFPAEGIYIRDVSATGETFHSRAEMRAYEKAHDLEIGA